VPNIERGLDGEWRQVPDQPARLPIPRNLIVIGTVNVDETTYQFSPKVLDRAMTFEIRTLTSELDASGRKPIPVSAGPESALRAFTEAATNDQWGDTGGSDFALTATALRSLHAELALTGDEFGQRVFYESIRLTSALERVGYAGADVALDHIVLLKILPRIHGSRRRVEPVLNSLLSFAKDPSAFIANVNVEQTSGPTPRLPLSAHKIGRMLRAVGLNQFVSFID
jgi:5-methylcytosine-specific restriction protein B